MNPFAMIKSSWGRVAAVVAAIGVPVAFAAQISGYSLRDAGAWLFPDPLSAEDKADLLRKTRDFVKDGVLSTEEQGTLRSYGSGRHIDPEALERYLAEIRPRLTESAVLLNAGFEKATNGGYREAYDDLSRAVKLDAGNPAAWADLSGVALETGRGGEAVQAGERAVQLDSENVEGHYNLAASLASEGKAAPAFDHLERSITLLLAGREASWTARQVAADLHESRHFASVRKQPRFLDLVERIELGGR